MTLLKDWDYYTLKYNLLHRIPASLKDWDYNICDYTIFIEQSRYLVISSS